MRLGIPLLVLAAAGCTAVDHVPEVQTAQAPVVAPKLEAKRLPPIDLVTFDAKATRLEAAAGGKPALVSLWATWCESCLAEMDALNRLDAKARPAGGMVIGVAVGESRQTSATFAQQRGLRYAQLSDEEFKLADALGAKRVPATLVLDREGRVVFTGGALDERALAAFRAVMEAR